MVASQAALLNAHEVALLEMIGRLPLVPARYLPALSGAVSPAALYRRLAGLRRLGLVATMSGPARGRGPRPSLLLLDNCGLAVLGYLRTVEPVALARCWRLNGAGLDAVARELPAVLASYELLALLASSVGKNARLARWSRPGRLALREGGDISLPACAMLEWMTAGGQLINRTYVLVADTGSLSPATLRPRLARLGRVVRTTGQDGPGLLIATTSPRRVEAWSAMLRNVGSSTRGGPLQARVATWEAWRSGRVMPPVVRLSAAPLSEFGALQTLRPETSRESWVSVPRPIRLDRARASAGEWDLGAGARAALDLVARHPFLPATTLGEVLGKTARWVRERRAELVRRGLLRVVSVDELPANVPADIDLLEATPRGLMTLAGAMGMSLSTAIRCHGITGGGPNMPLGPRRVLLAHLAHTLGADSVFAMIACAARRSGRGTLLEWRNAAACAHGRVRPDGYGLLRLGRREYGFFVEFDRGTVRPSALRAKFAAYQRYRASARAPRDYDGFPTILVVTSGPGAEDRLVDAVLAASVGQPPLAVLLTTQALLRTHEAGALGPIWRVPHRNGMRLGWRFGA